MGWPKYEASSDNRRHILRIGPYKKHKNTEIITSIIHEDRAEKCAFWNQLFPKLLKATDLECQNKHQLFEENIKYLPVQGRDAQLENDSRNAPLRSPMQDSSLSSSITKLKDVSREHPFTSPEINPSPHIHGPPFKFTGFLNQLFPAYSEAIESCNTGNEREFC